VFGSVALMRAKFIDGPNTGLTVGDAPNYTAAAGVLYDDGKFYGSLMQKATGEQYGSIGEVGGTSTVNPDLNKIGAYFSTDLVMGYRLKDVPLLGPVKTTDIKFGISNLFDNHALTEISGTPTTTTASDPNNGLTYTFQSGRIIFGGLTITF
jgi:iron complex outermembrane receptor protein